MYSFDFNMAAGITSSPPSISLSNAAAALLSGPSPPSGPTSSSLPTMFLSISSPASNISLIFSSSFHSIIRYSKSCIATSIQCAISESSSFDHHINPSRATCSFRSNPFGNFRKCRFFLFNARSIKRRLSSKKKNEAGVDFNGRSNGADDNFLVLPPPSPPTPGELMLLPLSLVTVVSALSPDCCKEEEPTTTPSSLMGDFKRGGESALDLRFFFFFFLR
mmetsp:Transcript_28494/g.42309  ORF Transcript_28494/g.42309 Transcript_28494/m.42309 type:complete len:220 (+) Transcript_28494:116-775(+)